MICTFAVVTVIISIHILRKKIIHCVLYASAAVFCDEIRCRCCCQGANSDELDMVENEQLEVIESEGDGWIRVGTDYSLCLSDKYM